MSRYPCVLFILFALALMSSASASVGNLFEYVGVKSVPKSVEAVTSWGSKTVYNFEPDGKSAFVERFDKAGDANGTSLIAFSSDENRVIEIEYSAGGGEEGIWVYRYDDNGRLIEKEVTRPNFSNTTRYEYDDTANEMREVNAESYVVHQLNEDGKSIVVSRFDKDDSLQSVTENVYNDSSDIVETSSYDSSKALTTRSKFEYEYDADGNWTLKTEYKWVPSLERFERDGSTTQRQFLYY